MGKDKDLEKIRQGEGIAASDIRAVESSGLRYKNEDSKKRSMATLYWLLFVIKRAM